MPLVQVYIYIDILYIEYTQKYTHCCRISALDSPFDLVYTILAYQAAQVYTILDSRNYCLPQRRNRVWGIASLNDGRVSEKEKAHCFSACLESLRSNFQFDLRTNFPDRRKEQVKIAPETL